MIEEVKHMEDRVFEFEMAEQRVLLLAEELPKERKNKAGIIIPDNVEDERPRICKVIRVGNGNVDVPMAYKPGQFVLMSKYSGKEIDINVQGHGWDTYLVTNQIDIMAKLFEVKEASE